MDGAEVLQPESDQVFRLTYTSRAAAEMPRGAVVSLARDAAANNLRTEVTGVLLADAGVFVQWLEGPKAHVDALMARIAADPRHRDVSVLSAGWAAERRFPDWPMQLAGTGLTQGDVRTAAGPPVDADGAMRAFDRAAALRSRAAAAIERNALDAAADVEAFAERLASCTATQLPKFPPLVLEDLGRRARWVDEVCGIFARGWRDDVWSSAEVVLGLAHLNRLWQRAGRVPEPVRPLDRAAVVVPPGSQEMIGAIVKADLLRAGG
ncbi:MAG: BLUF domain-containing protein, partial [Pseudomonadota bacterium]